MAATSFDVTARAIGPRAWRWLHTQAQPQADLVRANVTDLPAVLLNPPWLKKRAKGFP